MLVSAAFWLVSSDGTKKLVMSLYSDSTVSEPTPARAVSIALTVSSKYTTPLGFIEALSYTLRVRTGATCAFHAGTSQPDT